MDYKNITVNKEGSVAFLALNRPEENNMLNREMFAEIIKGLEELDEDDEIRVIIVKGAGDNFCFGADVSEIMKLDEAGCHDFFSGLSEMYKIFHRIDKVTIAMVHGYCTAGGMGVAVSCDLIVAADDAQFGATAVKVGLFCMPVSGVMLPQIVGGKKALEMALTGELIDGREAERLGIVNKVVPMDKLESATMELAGKILNRSPLSIIMGKRNFYACADMEYDKGLEYSAEMFATLAATRGAKDVMKAFLGKRKSHS